MNVKTSKAKKQVNIENETVNLLSKEELNKRIEVIKKELRSYTWRELETKGKFVKNDKLSFITDDMLIVGCDIGSEMHYIRAIDVRGRELSRGAFEFSNTAEGFENARAWVLELAAKNEKKQIVLGLEPTGHYWFVLAAWMISNGISVVQVNPYAVKQSKEIEDNSQLKDDRKDPKLIANLVKCRSVSNKGHCAMQPREQSSLGHGLSPYKKAKKQIFLRERAPDEICFYLFCMACSFREKKCLHYGKRYGRLIFAVT